MFQELDIKSEKVKILNMLSELLQMPYLFQSVSNLFSPILPELIQRSLLICLKNTETDEILSDRILPACYCLSSLMLHYPYVAKSTFRLWNKFHQLCLSFEKNDDIRDEHCLLICKACYNLLTFSTDRFHSYIAWNLIIKCLDNGKPDVRWYAFKSIAVDVRFSDHSEAVLKSLPEEHHRKFLMSLSDDDAKYFHPSRSELTEISTVSDADGLIDSDRSEMRQHSNGAETLFLENTDIQGNLVSIAGLLIPRKEGPITILPLRSSFVSTENAERNLKSLAIAVTSGTPVLVEGEVGTGKTVLVEYFASLTGRTQSPDILKLQLGEQTDTKVT